MHVAGTREYSRTARRHTLVGAGRRSSSIGPAGARLWDAAGGVLRRRHCAEQNNTAGSRVAARCAARQRVATLLHCAAWHLAAGNAESANLDAAMHMSNEMSRRLRLARSAGGTSSWRWAVRATRVLARTLGAVEASGRLGPGGDGHGGSARWRSLVTATIAVGNDVAVELVRRQPSGQTRERARRLMRGIGFGSGASAGAQALRLVAQLG